MRNRFKRRPSPSMAVAVLALFVALGGTAAAAKVLITSSRQIKAGTVSRSDLHKSAVSSSKVANGSLTLRDLNSAARGAIKDAGTQAPQSTQATPALEAFRLAGPQNVPSTKAEKVATLSDIPAGAYAIFAKSVLTAKNPDGGVLLPGGSVGGHCVLDATGDRDESRALLGSPGASAPGGVNMQITRTFEGTGTATVTCDVTGAAWSATNTSIIAVRVGLFPRQSVQQR